MIRWPDHTGFATSEGQELNESARGFGDDPADWFVSESPVDVLKVREVWSSPSIRKPKLEPRPEYLPHLRRMVTLCAEGRQKGEGVFIPPTWLNEKQAQLLTASLGMKQAGDPYTFAAPDSAFARS